MISEKAFTGESVIKLDYKRTFISEENPSEKLGSTMSGEKLTDEEVLAAHKIVPLCGEPR